jgi:hypothetical protein
VGGPKPTNQRLLIRSNLILYLPLNIVKYNLIQTVNEKRTGATVLLDDIPREREKEFHNLNIQNKIVYIIGSLCENM